MDMDRIIQEEERTDAAGCLASMFFIAMMIFIIALILAINAIKDKATDDLEPLTEEISFVDADNESIIDTMRIINAFMSVESGFNDSAIGTKNDVGCLQITPVFVADANRIAGEERFTLDDRYDREKSIEMFVVVHSYYNPGFNLEKSCKIHNPRAGDWYTERVRDEFNKQQNKLK